jgi:hypothetical protein
MPRGPLAAGLVAAAVALPVASLAAIFTFVASSAPPASTRTHRSAHTGRLAPVSGHRHDEPGYLALGDSVAFGYRPTPVTPPMGYLTPANFTGYPEDLAKMLRLHLVNAACPGETTSSMINSAVLNNGCESNVHGGPGYRSFAPLHVGYGGSQLSYAVRYLRRYPQTELVTIDIGANDIFVCEQTTGGLLLRHGAASARTSSPLKGLLWISPAKPSLSLGHRAASARRSPGDLPVSVPESSSTRHRRPRPASALPPS